MAWIDKKQSYDIVLQNWIIDSLKLYKTFEQVIKFIAETMKNWIVKLTTGGKSLPEMKIQRRIFHGDTLLPLLIVIAMNHSTTYQKCSGGDKLWKS